MLDDLAHLLEAAALLPAAVLLSWLSRRAIRFLTRRAVRRGRRPGSSWRVRLDRLGDDGMAELRKRQRADAVARIFGHVVTLVVFSIAVLLALELVGINPVYAISSAGFVGFALALSGQDLVKDLIGGTRALLEDRYAVGDDVELHVAGAEVRGTVDLVGVASVRLRTADGATWHAGHHVVDSVANFSQLPAVSDIAVPRDLWEHTDRDRASERLAAASNQPGLTGVVFLRDLETVAASQTSGPDDGDDRDDDVAVRVRSNRPLSGGQARRVRDHLLRE